MTISFQPLSQDITLFRRLTSSQQVVLLRQWSISTPDPAPAVALHNMAGLGRGRRYNLSPQPSDDLPRSRGQIDTMTSHSGRWARLLRVVERDMRAYNYPPPTQPPLPSTPYDRLPKYAHRAAARLATAPSPSLISLIARLARARKPAAPPCTGLPRHITNVPLPT